MNRQRFFLAVFALVLRIVPLGAQCIVETPGGSKTDINRPRDADVPAASSPISRINDALPDWLCFTAGYRARLEGYDGGGFRDNSDAYLLTRFRLGVAIKPTAWFRVYAEAQDATAFWKNPPLAPPYQSTWDLRRAYVDLGDIERSPVSFRVGRQDLSFGYARLVGTAYWRNASRGYDAAMMVVNLDWLRTNVFAASPVVMAENGLSHHQPGNNFYGIYNSMPKLIPGSEIQPYVFWRLTPGIRTEEGSLARLDEKVVGLRWAGVASRFDYDAEVTGETGNIGADRIRAWGWSAIGGYTLQSARLRPRFFVKYDFASGDRNPNDGTHGTFDQLYPNIHGHHGLADQIAWQNLKSIRPGVRISLRRNWTVAGMYNGWWLASAKDGFYSSSGIIVARDPRGLSGTHIGTEIDGETSYRFNRNLEVGVGVGHIFPGDFLKRTGHTHSYTYPYLMLNYNLY